MEPISTKPKGKEEAVPQKTGLFGKKTVSQDELSVIRSRFKKSCAKVNELNIDRISIWQRGFEKFSEWISGNVSEDKKKKFDELKENLRESQHLDLDNLNLQSIKAKLDKNEYLDPQEAKTLKKMLLIKSQEQVGVKDAAAKTEAFYRFDAVIESKTQEAFKSFEDQIKILGFQESLKGILKFVEGKVNKKENFGATEIEMVRDSIFSALKAKREKSDIDLIIAQKDEQQRILNDENTGLKKTNEGIKWVLEGAKDDLKELTKKNELQLNDNKKLIQEKERLDQLIVKLDKENENLCSELEGLELDIDEAKLELDELKIKHDDQLEEVQSDANKVKQENQSLRAEKERFLEQISDLNKMKNEYILLKEKTKNYDEIQNELMLIKGTFESWNARKEEFRQLDMNLNKTEEAFAAAQKKNLEMEAMVNTRAQELQAIQDTQEERLNEIRNATSNLILFGQVLGAQAVASEGLGKEFPLMYDADATEEAIELLNKEGSLTGEEVNHLKQLTYTMMKELEYEDDLRKQVPKKMENLRLEFNSAIDPQKYLRDLRGKIIEAGYPGLVISDVNPRVFVFFTDGKLLEIEINSEADIDDLQIALDACRHRAEIYERVEEQF